MNLFLILAYLFFIGSVFGWILEVFFRKYFSGFNPEHRWINPGFCTGPWLPVYGFGLCLMYLLASLGEARGLNGSPQSRILLLVLMALCMTLNEYIGGILLLKCANLRLWDYRKRWGNIDGLICPLFSFFWMLLGAFYYYLLHPHVLAAIRWLEDHLAFSFVIGLYFGVFLVDFIHSADLVAKIRKYAEEHKLIVRYERLKMHIRSSGKQLPGIARFLFPFRSERPITELLAEAHDALEKRRSSRSGQVKQ